LNGQDLDDADHVSLRSDWFFDFSDAVSLRVFGQYFDADNNGAAMKGLDDPTSNPRELAQDSASDYKLSSEVLAAILNIELGFADLKILASSQEDDIYVVRDNDRHNFGDIHGFGPLKGMPYIPAEFRPETSIVDTTTLEINLISNEPINEKIDWIIGALYFDHKIANSIYEVKDVNNIYMWDDMNGIFEPYVHDPICASDPFAGVCFAAYDAALGFVSEAYPTRVFCIPKSKNIPHVIFSIIGSLSIN
jgi:iron complex outermembrane receptor protein